MSEHEIKRGWGDRLKSMIPFGLGRTKPKHFRDMIKIVWGNRDNITYRCKVVSNGSETRVE